MCVSVPPVSVSAESAAAAAQRAAACWKCHPLDRLETLRWSRILGEQHRGEQEEKYELEKKEGKVGQGVG